MGVLIVMPTGLFGDSEIDDSTEPSVTTYSLFWTAAPGPARYDVRTGASTIINNGLETDFTWDVVRSNNGRSFSVRACYSDGNCSDWLGPLDL